MKTITIRNFVLSRDKKKAYYNCMEIIDCGISDTPQHYWVKLYNHESQTIETATLYMAEPIRVA